MAFFGEICCAQVGVSECESVTYVVLDQREGFHARGRPVRAITINSDVIAHIRPVVGETLRWLSDKVSAGTAATVAGTQYQRSRRR